MLPGAMFSPSCVRSSAPLAASRRVLASTTSQPSHSVSHRSFSLAGKRLQHAGLAPSCSSVADARGDELPMGLADDVRSRAQHRIRQVDSVKSDVVNPSHFLRDRFHRQHTYLRLSLTERCNLRCLYCMPEDGVPLTPKDHLLTTQEVQRLARLFVNQGVNKIRLTGGEPTVRRDLGEIVASLNELRPNGLQQIGITSNGISLARRLDSLVDSGLTHLNISLDTLDPFKFEFMTRRRGFDAVMKSIDRALELGVPSVKLNVVVIKGLNDGQDVLDFVEFTRDKPVVVRFIEYMPFDGNKWQVKKLVPYQDLVSTIRAKYPEFTRTAHSDDANDTSKHWRVPGHRGAVGFITSMTDNFCGTCNRLRVTADGNLKVCLFGNAEVSLRDAMRHGHGPISPLIAGSPGPATDDQLLHIIGPDQRSGARVRPRIASGSSLSRGSSLLMPSARRAFSTSALRRVAQDDGRTDHDDDGDDGPWGDLDAAFDKLDKTSSKSPGRAGDHSRGPRAVAPDHDFEEAIFAQAGAAAVGGKSLSDLGAMASMIPGNGMSAAQPHMHQTWSEYMGGTDEGDDSPWASLDAFADSSIDAAGRPGMRQPLSASSLAVQHTPRFHAGPSQSGYPAQEAPSAFSSTTQRSVLDVDAAALSQSLYQPPRHNGQAETMPSRLTHIDPGSGRASMVDVGHKASTRRSATAAGRVYLPAHAIALIRQAEGTAADVADGQALTKGPVLHTAQLAGIMAAKKTSDLIPLCHSLSLSHVDVRLQLIDPVQATGSAGATPSSEIGSPLTQAGEESAGFTLEQLEDPDSWPSMPISTATSPSGTAPAFDSSANRGYVEVSCTASTSGQTGVEMEALTGCTVACLTIWDMVKAVAGKEMTIGDIKVVAKTGGKSGDWTRIVD